MDKPSGSYSSWENTMCNSLAPIGEKTRLAWHDGYASAKSEWKGLTDEEIRNEAKNHVFDESFFSGAVWARGQIMGRNNGEKQWIRTSQK